MLSLNKDIMNWKHLVSWYVLLAEFESLLLRLLRGIEEIVCMRENKRLGKVVK